MTPNPQANRHGFDCRPPGHSGVCWASAVGTARHEVPLAGWDAAFELAGRMLTDGRKECLCRRSKRGRGQIR